jgi:two-component system response regulator HydG
MNRVLILDDDGAVLNSFVVLLAQARCYDVVPLSDSSQAFQVIADGNFDLLLLDMDMPVVTGMEVLRHVREHFPAIEVVVITGIGDVALAVEAMKLGARDYLCKPVDAARLLECLDRALERPRAREAAQHHREVAGRQAARFPEALKGFVTQDRKLAQTLAEIEPIARSDNNVLIVGESGTGKELVARAIHQMGRRADKPFLTVNAAAFASALFDSHFFGHERGAFTGADGARHGIFEEADGGTLFLDEVGDIEAPVQSKLLRVLQSGEYFRLGSNQSRRADVRILTATNKDLEAEIAAGRFRRDLFHRLNTSSIFLPPLRERKADVELLATYFLDKHGAACGKEIRTISEPAMRLLRQHPFPGNVRELENVIAGAIVLETGDALGIASLPPYLRAAAERHEGQAGVHAHKTLLDVEAEYIRTVLLQVDGNRTWAARILGISRVGLIAKLKRLGIDIEPGGGHQASVRPDRDPT